MAHTPEFWDKFITEHYKLLKQIVKRRFPNEPETAKEALSYVSEKLVEDNRRRLRLYDPERKNASGRNATEKTYFYKLVQYLLVSFLQNKFGRFRPPAWLRRLNNSFLTMVYKYLCWERRPETDVIEYLKSSAPDGRKAEVIQEAIRIIRYKDPDCGKAKEKEVQLDDTDDSPSAGETPEDHIFFKEWFRICQIILSDPDNEPELNESKIKSVMEKLRREFKPDPKQRLLLRMVYQDGMNITAAGRLLGWNKNQAQGHHRRLIEKLREIIGNDL